MALDTQQKRMSAAGVGRPWMRAIFPSSLDAIQRASVGLAYGGNTLATGAVVWLDSGGTIDPFPGASGSLYVHAAEFRAVTGTAHSRLYDVTAAAAVSGSEITTTDTSAGWVRSGTISLIKGNRYRAQFGTLAGDEGKHRERWQIELA